MALTKLLVPTYLQMLQALSTWLDKADATIAGEASDSGAGLMATRLADDMFPLSSQIRFSCLQAREAVYRLKGQAKPDMIDILAQEAQNAGEQPGTFSDAQLRIDETLSFLNALRADALDDGAERQIALALPNGMIFDMLGEQYARDWALPQFNFHLLMAYGILRQQGVPLGKADYVQHAFAYLRPGPMPSDI